MLANSEKWENNEWTEENRNSWIIYRSRTTFKRWIWLFKKSNPHYGERGTESEIILQKFLNEHLPKRFSADTGLIIDDNNKISSQIDVIIYDSLNSPVYQNGPFILEQNKPSNDIKNK